MARAKRRRPRPASAPRAIEATPRSLTLAHRRVAPARNWRWRTFPVFFTFAATLFVTALLAQIIEAGNISATILVLPGAIALALALAHFVTVLLVESRARPRDE